MGTYKKDIRQERRDLGLCIYCGNDAKGFRRCESCREKSNKATARWRDKNKEAGLCIKCGKPTSEGHTRCEDCLVSHNAVYSQRKQRGVCLYCGKSSDYGHCEICYLKKRATRHLGDASMWILLKKIFDDQQGICPYTGIELQIRANTELDHRIPRSKGGTDELSNLQWVYAPVNTMKWNMTEGEFLATVGKVAAHMLLENTLAAAQLQGQ